MRELRYRAAVFDMDGTILDTLGDLANAVNHSLKEFGLPPVTQETVRLNVGNGTRRLIEGVAGDIPAETKEALLEYEKAYYAGHADVLTKPYGGITELLLDLRAKGVKTAVVSNKFQAAVSGLAENYFPGLFDAAIGENEAAGIKKKPAPDMVLKALDMLGIPKEEALYIGDSEVDWLTAESVGTDLALADWGFRSFEEIMDFLGPEESKALAAAIRGPEGKAGLIHRPSDIAKLIYM